MKTKKIKAYLAVLEHLAEQVTLVDMTTNEQLKNFRVICGERHVLTMDALIENLSLEPCEAEDNLDLGEFMTHVANLADHWVKVNSFPDHDAKADEP